MVPMTVLKINLPERINESFRWIVSRRRGVQKGVLRNATLTAISRYIGSDPEIALIASKSFFSIEVPEQLVPKVLSVLLPNREVTFSVHFDLKEIEEKLGVVKAVYIDQGYTVFRWKPAETKLLSALKSFRVEWGEKELVFEEECVSLTTESLEESLSIAEKVAETVGLQMPQTPVPRQLEIYKWRDIDGQEVIIK